MVVTVIKMVRIDVETMTVANMIIMQMIRTPLIRFVDCDDSLYCVKD